VHEPSHNTTLPCLTVAVTGGTGFIGRAIIRRLLQAGVQVKALVRPASVSSCYEVSGLSWVCGELSDETTLRQLLDGVSAVVHCAGSVRGTSLKDFVPANIASVAQIVQVAGSQVVIPRLLLISSLAARSPDLSDYAASKRQGEEVLRSTAGAINWTILRPPAVYGPGDRELLPLLQWIRRGLAFVPGGGAGRFSMIYINDLVEAVLSWLQYGSGAAGCYEVHDGKVGGYSWDDVCSIAVELYQRPVRRINIARGLLSSAAALNLALARLVGYQPMLTPGKVRELCHDNWVCDDRAFGCATGWHPQIGLREGLLRTLS